MLPKLVSLSGFQQRAGLSSEELQAAAFAGILPNSIGAIDGVPHWQESDVSAFIALHGQRRAVDELVSTAESLTKPAATNGVMRAAAIPAEPSPARAAETSTAPALLPPASPLTKLEKQLTRAIKFIHEGVPTLHGLPKMLRVMVPKQFLSMPVKFNPSAKRANYTSAQIAAFFNVPNKTIDKYVITLKPVSMHGRAKIYSHAQVMELWNSREWRTIPLHTLEGAANFKQWLDALRERVALREAGDRSVRPLKTASDVMALAPIAVPVIPMPEAPDLSTAPHRQPEPAPVQTVTVGEWKPGDWISERAAADHLGLSVEVMRIIRKDKIGPANSYRDGTVQYRVIDVESWKAANLPVIAGWRGKPADEFLALPDAAAFLGMSVSSLQRITFPSYNGPNPGPAAVIRDKRTSFSKLGLIAWKEHNRPVIEAHQRNSALRGDLIRAAQKKAVIAIKKKTAAKKAAASGNVEPARRLLDDKPVSDTGKRLVKKIQPALDKLASEQQRAASNPSMAALANGRATMADKLAGAKLGDRVASR